MRNSESTNGLVSVVIPARNEGKTLTPDVSALLGAFWEEGVRSEVVIVDAGSSYNISAVIEGWQTACPEVKEVCKAPRHGFNLAVMLRNFPVRAEQLNRAVELAVKSVLSGARFGVAANNRPQREAGTSSAHLLKQSLFCRVDIHWVLNGGQRFRRLKAVGVSGRGLRRGKHGF